MNNQNDQVSAEGAVDEAPRPAEPDAAPVEGPPGRSEGHVEDLAAVRDLALRAHPDTVPELVGGATVAEIVASLEPARAAYRRVAERAGGSAVGTSGTPITVANRLPPVPAGDAPRSVVDPDRLSAGEKIRRGLAERHGS